MHSIRVYTIACDRGDTYMQHNNSSGVSIHIYIYIHTYTYDSITVCIYSMYI